MTHNTYIVGQTVVLGVLLKRTATGEVVTDPTLAVTIYKPDGSTVAGSVIYPGVDDPDAYEVQVTVDVPGWWEYISNAIGNGAGSGRERFYVSPVP